jgi:hypothetical protein
LIWRLFIKILLWIVLPTLSAELSVHDLASNFFTLHARSLAFEIWDELVTFQHINQVLNIVVIRVLIITVHDLVGFNLESDFTPVVFWVDEFDVDCNVAIIAVRDSILDFEKSGAFDLIAVIRIRLLCDCTVKVLCSCHSAP